MGGVLQYKWEVYCRVSHSSSLRSQEGNSDTNGGAYCRTNRRCTAVFSSRSTIRVGVSETLLIQDSRAEHLLCESHIGALKLANRRFEGIRANRWNIMKIGGFSRAA